MEPLNLHEVAAATRGTLGKPQVPVLVRGVSTDSRQVRPGDLFVCLEGPHFDGHRFAAQAASRGAVALLVHRAVEEVDLPTVTVPDTRVALGALARFVRLRQRDLTVVAVTGTNGKTSTKDFTAAALSARYPTVAAQRSFNNDVGVPLTLLDLERETRAAVVEIGTSGPGEIARLAALARPEIAVITNIERAHLQGLGSIDGVRAEKASLLDALEGREVAVLNRDDPSFAVLDDRAPGPVISFGLERGADVHAEDVEVDVHGTRFTLGGRHAVRLQHHGRHAVYNALAAIACACICGVELDAAIDRLARVPPPPGRLQPRRVGEVTVFDDSYNANPASLAAALGALAEMRLPARKILVLGDMLELGQHASELHREAGRLAAEAGPACLVAVGEHAEDVVGEARRHGLDEASAVACTGIEDAAEAVRAVLAPGDVVLLKGSRGMRLERLVDELALSRRIVA